MKSIIRSRLFSRKGLLFTLIPVIMILCFVGGYLTAAQPHMQNALKSLNTAKTELQSATPDKGGHRVKAIGLVNSAIDEVQKGIKAGAK